MRDKIIKNDLAQREAGRTFQRAGKRKPATEYDEAQEAFRKNYERLKAERLAREAAKSKGETVAK
ncbi:MAG TPA: hypothetical protein VKS24_19480 [Bradyrhizobium sp.]|nr:hypothetical protein [Bradyrhizobium sp.]